MPSGVYERTKPDTKRWRSLAEMCWECADGDPLLALSLAVSYHDQYNERQTHCQRGHELFGANVRKRKNGKWTSRVCLQCERERASDRRDEVNALNRKRRRSV